MCLAGHPSPLLREPRSEYQNGPIPALSPPERALLSTVTHLSNLHAKIKKNAASLSASHKSITCRAVASTITTVQLHRFMTKIVQVEKSILSKDASLVGGYDIVPLSALVGEFTPWTRRLEWLWKVVNFMQHGPGNAESSFECTGRMVVDFLRKESYTGYHDVERLARELVKTAEMVWLRHLSTWLLYGKLSVIGSEDFFIRSGAGDRVEGHSTHSGFKIDVELLPEFVQSATASSILFIGQSLIQVQTHGQSGAAGQASPDPALRLIPAHLDLLEKIESPISSSRLANVISAIRMSISQNLLSHLLPVSQTLEILHVLQDFFLLRRSEYATSLISNAGKRLDSQHLEQQSLVPIRKASRLEHMTVKDGDLATMLNQTWSELVALQTNEDILDDVLERAREWISITCKRQTTAGKSSVDFSNLIFPVPVSCALRLPKNSPVTLFLSHTDVSAYSEVCFYLLALRRSQMHLASLWRNSSFRRSLSQRTKGRRALKENRAANESRERQRNVGMRQYWATATKCHFVIAELAGYLQGDIVNGHTEHFLLWIGAMTRDHSSKTASRPGTSREVKERGSLQDKIGLAGQSENYQPVAANDKNDSTALKSSEQSDPASLAKAHHRFVAALRSSSLLDVDVFTRVLYRLLKLIDHFVALFQRLATTEESLDLEFHDGFADPVADHRKEHREILHEFRRGREAIEEQLNQLIQALQDSVDVVQTHNDSDIQRGISEMDFEKSSYVPWRAPSVDGLLMRLESVGSMQRSQLMDEDEDEDDRYYSS